MDRRSHRQTEKQPLPVGKKPNLAAASGSQASNNTKPKEKKDKWRMEGTPIKGCPRSQDVIFGRGGLAQIHEGNTYFRALVQQHKPRYNATHRTQKQGVAAEICKKIAAGGGRFLEKQGDIWCEVTPRRSIEKTCQALREKKWNYFDTIDNETLEGFGISMGAQPEGVSYIYEHEDSIVVTIKLKPKTNKDPPAADEDDDDSTVSRAGDATSKDNVSARKPPPVAKKSPKKPFVEDKASARKPPPVANKPPKKRILEEKVSARKPPKKRILEDKASARKPPPAAKKPPKKRVVEEKASVRKPPPPKTKGTPMKRQASSGKLSESDGSRSKRRKFASKLPAQPKPKVVTVVGKGNLEVESEKTKIARNKRAIRRNRKGGKADSASKAASNDAAAIAPMVSGKSTTKETATKRSEEFTTQKKQAEVGSGGKDSNKKKENKSTPKDISAKAPPRHPDNVGTEVSEVDTIPPPTQLRASPTMVFLLPQVATSGVPLPAAKLYVPKPTTCTGIPAASLCSTPRTVMASNPVMASGAETPQDKKHKPEPQSRAEVAYVRPLAFSTTEPHPKSSSCPVAPVWRTPHGVASRPLAFDRIHANDEMASVSPSWILSQMTSVSPLGVPTTAGMSSLTPPSGLRRISGSTASTGTSFRFGGTQASAFSPDDSSFLRGPLPPSHTSPSLPIPPGSPSLLPAAPQTELFSTQSLSLLSALFSPGSSALPAMEQLAGFEDEQLPVFTRTMRTLLD